MVSTFKSSVETDHLGLIVKPAIRTRPSRNTVQFRLFSSRGQQRLNNILKPVNYETLPSIEDIDEAAETNIAVCFENAFPLRKVRMSDKDPLRLTQEAKWLIKKKKQALRKGKERKKTMIENKLRKEMSLQK